MIVGCIVAISLGVGTEPARAASIACPAGIGNDLFIADNVTPNSGCELGSTFNDSLGGDPTLFQVNVDTMFGFSDWEFAGKTLEAEAGAIDIGLSAIGGGLSGSWSISDIWPSGIADLMLVFKGGVSKEPGSYVGYLITHGATSGLYTTPFRNPNGKGSATDTSHISAYVRYADIINPDPDPDPDPEDVHSVPEPASLVLLGCGFAALAHVRRRQLKR